MSIRRSEIPEKSTENHQITFQNMKRRQRPGPSVDEFASDDSDVESELRSSYIAAATGNSSASAAAPVEHINNKPGLRHALGGLLKECEWLDRLEVVAPDPITVPVEDETKLEIAL